MKPTDAKILFGSLWPVAPEGLMVTAVVTDSREVQKNCVFVAIQGERADGHDYAAGAVRDGAAAVVATRPVEGVDARHTVLVQDPLDAMIELGKNYRKQFQPLVLGITGSVGKTTTKEYCAAVFSAFGETVKTEGNQNNEIGMPNTLFRLNDSTSYAVVEMGAQNVGDIRKLSMAACPNASIITRIGEAHLETFGTVENVLRAKLEICEGMPEGAPLVLNGDDERLFGAVLPDGVRAVYAGIDNEACEVRAVNIKKNGEGQNFVIGDKRYGRFSAVIRALGAHSITNALLAYTAATRLGLSAETAAKALSAYRPGDMRQNIVHRNGITVIEDCYNANPDSMRAALGALAALETEGGRIAVLGDMLELGDVSERAHEQLGALCAENNVSLLITVGERAAAAVPKAVELGVEARAFSANAEAAVLLRRCCKEGDAILVKASRGMHFEEILQQLEETADL